MSDILTYRIPMFLPPQWVIEDWGDGRKFVNYNEGQIVIVDDEIKSDGKRWRHLSMSCANRVPTWEELQKCKELFLGVESKAVMVLPPRSEYVNLNSRVLHLFVCLEGDPLPDFTGGGSTL